MLTYLDILNGELSPNFDSYNTLYTVQLDSDEVSLDLKYFTDDNVTVEIFNNDNLLSGENRVIINVRNNDEVTEEYVLVVNKEETVAAFNEVQNTALVNNSEMIETPSYVVPLLLVTVLSLIFIMYKIIFRKKKRF